MITIRPDVDLTPIERRIRRRMNTVEFAVTLALICALVLVAGQGAIAWSVNRDLTAALNRAEQRLASLRPLELEARQLELVVDTYRHHADAVEELMTTIRPWDELLAEIAARLPASLWMVSIHLETEAVVIDGYAVDHDAVAQALDELAESAASADAVLQLSEHVRVSERDMVRFRVVLTPDW